MLPLPLDLSNDLFLTKQKKLIQAGEKKSPLELFRWRFEGLEFGYIDEIIFQFST